MKYSENVINFFKKYNLYEEEMFEYLQSNTYFIDYSNIDARSYVGCYFLLNSNKNKIMNLKLCIPECKDEITTLIAIREIAHGIYGYKHRNRKYKEIEIELFPMIVERTFINETKSKLLMDYTKRLESFIDNDSEEKYRFALDSKDKVEDIDEFNFKSFDKLTKKLVRKWKRDNR